jgi:hypothetical protein
MHFPLPQITLSRKPTRTSILYLITAAQNNYFILMKVKRLCFVRNNCLKNKVFHQRIIT